MRPMTITVECEACLHENAVVPIEAGNAGFVDREVPEGTECEECGHELETTPKDKTTEAVSSYTPGRQIRFEVYESIDGSNHYVRFGECVASPPMSEGICKEHARALNEALDQRDAALLEQRDALLEALRDLVKSGDRYMQYHAEKFYPEGFGPVGLNPALDEARAAIALAEGEARDA